MDDSGSVENEFLNQLTTTVEENMSNENFGVSELAAEIGMSRSNLLRKVKKLTKISVSQFIRNVRLKKAMEMLKQTSFNVSEVSFKVGFSSTSYFTKCFHDYFGYPPGEVGKRDLEEESQSNPEVSSKQSNLSLVLGLVSLVCMGIAMFIYFKPRPKQFANLEKTIAVLPFVNNSNDSTNVYLINGLMESLLNNLQQIEDLKVVSRTSVEKYRNSTKSITEIAKELNVNYFIEGSGQKIGDQIVLHVQLIQGSNDQHLWAERYMRQTKDIFELQAEVAKKVADKIQAVITPEEAKRIEEVPTDNLEAYDYFLKGQDLFNKGNLEASIPLFKQAIAHDNEFARTYAIIAKAYYYLDIAQADKKYAAEINNNADKALLYDEHAPQSLIAKALFYMHGAQYEQAVPYLEKALEYNPNSAIVINALSDFYARYSPNTEKYLKYALKGIQLDIGANDSTTASYINLHVSNALIQCGFVEEALHYVNQSLAYDSTNLYSEYLKAFVLYAKNNNLERTKELLITALKKDTTRLDILQEVGKICYYMGDYNSAYFFYEKFVNAREVYNLNIYVHQNGTIGEVYAKVGLHEESEELYEEFKNWAENNQSVYQSISLAMYYAHVGDQGKVLEQMRLFSQQENFQYWVLLFAPKDPWIENLKDIPEFKEIWKDIETNFWNNHERIKASLKEKGLL